MLPLNFYSSGPVMVGSSPRKVGDVVTVFLRLVLGVLSEVGREKKHVPSGGSRRETVRNSVVDTEVVKHAGK